MKNNMLTKLFKKSQKDETKKDFSKYVKNTKVIKKW